MINYSDDLLRKTAGTAAGMALALYAAVPALADDTEVLLGSRLDPGEPNIVFMIDTSGSMNSDVVVGTDYDPERSYTGTCSTDRIYWTRNSAGRITVPDCRLGNWVNTDAFVCDQGNTAIKSEGFFRDRFSQWDATAEPPFWEVVAFASAGAGVPGRDRPTECRADSGMHGDTAGDFYIANGADGPWTTDSDRGLDWSATGDLYTFYHGNYLNWIQETGEETTISTRMDIVRRVAADVIAPLTGVNVSMMRFSTDSQGGMVIHEMVPVAEGRETLLRTVESLESNGGTPLAETLYEAGQYYGDRAVHYGLTSVGATGEPQPSVPASRDGDNYATPVTRQCQRNYVVLLTDGFPASDTDADSRIEALPGFSATIGSCSGSCLDEMARYLDEVDQLPGGTFPGPQTVQTYTIGFHTDQALLRNTATGVVPVRGADGTIVVDADGDPVMEPGYFTATDQEGLTAAFEDIISAIQTAGESFTAPSLAVDVQNRLTNREDVFLAMFEPSERGEPHWNGNLKKYRLGRPTGASSDSTPRIIDANGRAAIDDSGLFVAGAQSFWSTSPDEGTVTAGGFTETLTTTRRVYSNIVGGALTSTGNQVVEANADLTSELLGLTDPATRDAVIRFARGLGPDGEARQAIGDPLHSEPVILAYSGERFVLFFGTNDGYLHALNPEPEGRGVTDIEHFAFIPRQLLPLLDTMRRNEPRVGAGKEYGMDGPLRLWIDEAEPGNDVVDAGERAFLFAGMRRGGRNYYALEVTDIDNPRLAWTIEGGRGDFAELGQTWSAPIISRVRIGGSARNVLLFAGGYDTNQDSLDRPTTADDSGRAIYMVDALTGERLWWASIRDEADLTLEHMTHSIPSSLRVVDVDQDGYDDRIYVGDTAAQMWRFDINNATGEITGARLAALGGTREAGNRRIFYPPSVTRIVDEALGTFLTVAFGTGNRAHPLEMDVNNAFFMLRDRHPFVPPVDPTSGMIDYPDPIEPLDLLDITSDATPSTETLAARDGWFIRFESSEKNLSASVAILNRLFFTTYTPTRPTPDCTPTPIIGSGRLYAIDILTGSPVNHADAPVPEDRYRDLDSGGLPPTPRLVFTEPVCDDCDPSEMPVSEVTLLVGTEALDPGILNVPHRTYWVQEDIDR